MEIARIRIKYYEKLGLWRISIEDGQYNIDITLWSETCPEVLRE